MRLFAAMVQIHFTPTGGNEVIFYLRLMDEIQGQLNQPNSIGKTGLCVAF